MWLLLEIECQHCIGGGAGLIIPPLYCSCPLSTCFFLASHHPPPLGCYFEWTIGSANMKLELSEIGERWNAFVECLQATLQKQGVVTHA